MKFIKTFEMVSQEWNKNNGWRKKKPPMKLTSDMLAGWFSAARRTSYKLVISK
ncbi:hypothetical protein N0K21_07710 [Yersinia aleksiciae]|uniref:hypothetical protein n=1 Tax=Yersinia aleksiciae TaxID=263819 RepID=UPI002E14C01E|nr:hypothetical protein N0K21_07710 [Yersinia aleksiciae]